MWKVDVCKVNHQGYLDAMTKGFVQNIQAGHYIFLVCDYQHIQSLVRKRITSVDLHSGKKAKLYFTHIPESIRCKCNLRQWGFQIAGENGHVIVKVYSNVDEYKIYIVSAENEKMVVKAVYGPFYSKKDN